MLSAVVITRNEEARIGRCLTSLSFCDEIVVVDSGSDDQTTLEAAKLGARVLVRPFDDFASQKNFAVSQARGTWVLSVDADEVAAPGLGEEILRVLQAAEVFAAYALPRHNFIFGKRLRFGGNGKDAPIRLFRKGRAVFEGLVHESLRVEGAVGRLKGTLLHYSTSDMRRYFQKLTLYAALEAERLQEQKARFSFFTLCSKPVGRFFQRYIVQGGFLDGTPGFLFAAFSGYYEFVRYAIFWEMRGEFFDKMNRSERLGKEGG
jgi:glycosyltransferase involved in cell wall biosynthesis